ncbi:MAG: ribbon-helix-helix protein, CopG family [Thermodesulfobacteriota bacterium]
MKTLSLKIPDDLDAKLDTAVSRRGGTKSALTRQALEAFLREGERAAQGSVLDLAADLAGSLEGPPDLSCNEDHLEGYGR